MRESAPQTTFSRGYAETPGRPPRFRKPLTAGDRKAGYFHRLSVWQLEVSHTRVFSDPVWGRQFFEAVIRENLDLGRPDRVQLVFDRKIIFQPAGRRRRSLRHPTGAHHCPL